MSIPPLGGIPFEASALAEGRSERSERRGGVNNNEPLVFPQIGLFNYRKF